VTSDGYIHASGGGDIAGWNIKDDRLYTTDGKGRNILTLQSSSFSPTYQQGKIFSNTHNSLVSTVNGFYLSDDGLSIGSKVKIDQSGVMKLGAGAVADAPNNKYWTIDGSKGNSSISYGTKGESNSVYLGTDSISLGNTFSVTNNGYLVAASGTVGGWNIDSNTIQSTNKGLTLNSSGTLQGDGWYIDKGGFHGTTGGSLNGFNLTGGLLQSTAGTIQNGSGWLGSSSSGSAPLTWNGKGVAMKLGATIGDFDIASSNDGTGLTANNGGLVKITRNNINCGILQADTIRIKGKSGIRVPHSGKMTFSDGSWMEFESGLLVDFKIVNSQ
jgi:hypothetical protein